MVLYIEWIFGRRHEAVEVSSCHSNVLCTVQGRTHVMQVKTICSLKLTALALFTALPLAQYRPAILTLPVVSSCSLPLHATLLSAFFDVSLHIIAPPTRYNMRPMLLLPAYRRLRLCDDGTRPVFEHAFPPDDADDLVQAERLSQRLSSSHSLYSTLACRRCDHPALQTFCGLCICCD